MISDNPANEHSLAVDSCMFTSGSVGSGVVISLHDADLSISNSQFHGIRTAIESSGVCSIDARNILHNESVYIPDSSTETNSENESMTAQKVTNAEFRWGADATSLELVRRFANAYV